MKWQKLSSMNRFTAGNFVLEEITIPHYDKEYVAYYMKDWDDSNDMQKELCQGIGASKQEALNDLFHRMKDLENTLHKACDKLKLKLKLEKEEN